MFETFQLILIGVLLVLTTALGYGFYMLFRWKVSFEGKEIVAFPSNQLDDFYVGVKELSKLVSLSAQEITRSSKDSNEGHTKVFERVQALLKAVSETRAEYRTLRDEIDSKSSELDRYKSGYDLRIIRQCIEPVLANHALAVAELSRPDMNNDHRQFVELMNEGYADLLDAYDIRIEIPKLGSPFRDAIGVKLPPETIPANSDEQIGTIAGVKSPCYVMNYDGSAVVVRESHIVVYAENNSTQES